MLNVRYLIFNKLTFNFSCFFIFFICSLDSFFILHFKMAKLQVWLVLFLSIAVFWLLVNAEIPSSQLPLEARIDDSQEEDIISTSYVLPNQIFNDGKPYYASKDPISGIL